jgi:regulator of nucleoside diphosphate kinase
MVGYAGSNRKSADNGPPTMSPPQSQAQHGAVVSAPSPPRPCIFLTVDDARRLVPLTRQPGAGPPPARALLAEELARAQLCDPAEMPARIVRLGSRLRYRDLATRKEHLVQLVLPSDADPAEGRISVLDEPGAALIGVPQDMVFRWRDARGRLQGVQVLEVLDDFLWR